ncbi:MAG: SWIM zinc finger family protein [Leucobacter sp.]
MGQLAPPLARGFALPSTASGSELSLGLAPALTPAGLDASPSFFHGFATHPRALAQGLVALADITATRYFQFTPTNLRDPVLTAHGDRLRAEAFSADTSVYARLDVLGEGLDGGEIAHGTTNVDIGRTTRQALALITRSDLLHLDVGRDGLTASTPAGTVNERPVEMPDRWVRALGNAAELHTALAPRFELSAAQGRALIAGVPPVTAQGRSGWLIPTGGGARIGSRPERDAVWVDGLNRLSGLKRLLAQQTGMTVYGPSDGSKGAAAVEVALPGARLILALTEAATRGYSGEGALLTALATPGVLDDAALISALLAFEPVIDVPRLALDAALDESAVRAALAVLASSGRVGWDIRDGAYFHRELPDDPNRVRQDNPRLVRALGIAERQGAVRPASESETGAASEAWLVDGGSGVHRVSGGAGERSCTCTWYLRHGAGRGPCAHVLAVGIFEREIAPPERH